MQEGSAFRLRLETLPCPSPRAKYNLHFISSLLGALEENPETDLGQRISKYDSDRLGKLWSMSMEFAGGGTVQQADREETDSWAQVPEPKGEFRIIWPLAAPVKALLALPEYTSNGSQDPPSDHWRLLKKGEVLLHLFSKWVIRISPSIVVKFAPDLDISEIQTMSYIWSKREKIPMPEPLGALSIGSWNYIFISNIDGAPLDTLWQLLSPELKSSVQSQLGDILRCLREMPLPSSFLRSGNPPRCRDLRRHTRVSEGSISTKAEFNNFLVSTARDLNPNYLDLSTSLLKTNHRIVMTHSDIRPASVLVWYTNPQIIQITGLVDWELSGAYPEYWEYVKATAGVNWSLSDWYSYLPVETIGNHAHAWIQDCCIDRLVL